jgi:hypothetical protein
MKESAARPHRVLGVIHALLVWLQVQFLLLWSCMREGLCAVLIGGERQLLWCRDQGLREAQSRSVSVREMLDCLR